MPAVMVPGNERWECKLHPSCFGRQILRRPRAGRTRTRPPATLTALRKPAYIIGFSSAGWLCGFRLFVRAFSECRRPSPPPRAPHPHLSFALPAPSLPLSPSPSLNNSGKLFLQLVDLLLHDEETEGGKRRTRRMINSKDHRRRSFL